MFVKCFLLLQNSNPRTEVDKDLCIVISSFVEIWWLKSYTSEKHLFRTTWAWPVSWHDKGHWHTALSFQVVTFVCPFSRAQESQILNCHQVTAEYSDHRLKGRAHCLFVPFPGPSHWSLTKGPFPFQFEGSHTFHLQVHAEARLSLCWNVVVQNTFEIEVPC